jgi:hypothetical protein
MEAQSKRLWIVTAVNIVVAILITVFLCGVMVALAALAPVVDGRTLYILWPISLALSVTGLWFTKTVASRNSRRIGFVINGCVLAFDLLIVLGVAKVFLGGVNERFLIPDGYKGDVYVVHGARDGESFNKTGSGVTYRIPGDGILRTKDSMLHGATRTEYYYERKDGSLERIRNFWPTTIHQTPENLANDRDIGVFFPRTGSFTDSKGCAVQFELFYVGTKAHLLSEYRPTGLGAYVRDHPEACSN